MSFWYLASPYSKYPHGTEAAFEEVCRQAALLMRSHVKVFSPIAHSHPIAIHGNIPTNDHDFWLDMDLSYIRPAIGMIQLRMEGWSNSFGMGWEAEQFEQLNKPVIPMTPGEVPDALYTFRAA